MSVGNLLELFLDPLALLGVGIPFLWTVKDLNQLNSRFRQQEEALKSLNANLSSLSKDTTPDTILAAAKNNPHLAARLVRVAYHNRELPNASMDPLLAPLVEETSSWLTPLRTRPNLMMLAGLVVTLIGLTLSISSLELNSEQMTAESLSASLPNVLNNMGGAFVGSLMGVVFAIVTGWLLSKLVQRQQAYLGALAEFAHSTVAPLLIRPRFDEQVDRLTRAIDASSHMYDRVREGITESTTQFAKLLDSAGALVADQLKELKSSAEQVYGSLAQVSTNVQASAEALQGSSRDLQGYHNDLKHAHTELERMFKRSQEDLDRRSQELLDQMNDMQRGYGLSAQEVMGRIQSTAERLDLVHQGLQTTAERIDHNTERVTLGVDGSFKSLHGLLDTTLSAHQREMNDVSTKLSGFTSTLTQVIDVNRDLQRISEQVQKAEDQRATAVITAMSETGLSVSNTVQVLSERMGEQQRAFTTATNQLSERIGQEITSLAQAVQAQPDQFTAMLAALREGLQETLLGLAEALHQETASLNDVLVRQGPMFEGLLAKTSSAQSQALADHTAAAAAQLDALQRVIAEQGPVFAAATAAQSQGVQHALRPLQELPGLIATAQSQIDALRTVLQDQTKHVTTLIDAQSSAQQDVHAALRSEIQALGATVGAQPQQFQQLLSTHQAELGEHRRQWTEQFTAQPQHISQALQEPIERSQVAVQSLLEPLQAVQHSLSRVEESLNGGVQRLELAIARSLTATRPLDVTPAETSVS